ncbi:MAG TPA: Clp protease N-terminal domain-containing protein [Thermoleophilaceae bacterium]|nr:Clp protease N-terminal domain-containing protein [Thermoleophilaceae bacterium]
MGVEPRKVERQIVRLVGTGEEVTAGVIPYTPRAKWALEKSVAEAMSLGTDAIGAEHLLLGLVREADGVAARILINLGTDPEVLRWRVLRGLGHPAALARDVAAKRQRLRAIEGQLSVSDRREEVARIVGEAKNEEDAARALCRELDLLPDQAEAVLESRISAWTSAENARLEQERDTLRAELGSEN